jgi:hypothetical protein
MSGEVLLVSAVLAAACLPLLLWAWRRSAGWGRVTLIGAVAAAVALAVALGGAYQRSAQQAAELPSARPIEERVDGYTSSQACRACHPDQYASWHDSYHRTMTQPASAESVLAPFDGRVVEIGRRYRLERRGDEFWAVSDDPSWLQAEVAEPRNERRIVLVSGFHHHQIYWFESGHGRQLGRLPFFYRVEEQRFAPFQAVFLAKDLPTEFSGDAVWNSACIRCHATSPRPGFGDFTNMDTKVAEFGIACESCHGPGEAHVERNRDPLRRYLMHFGDEGDDSIVNPRRLSGPLATGVCGFCHSAHVFRDIETARNFSEHGPSFRPGDDLEKFWQVVRASEPPSEILNANLARDPNWLEDRFWPDGMVNVVGREYNAVTASPCFRGGEFSCISCHDMHPDPDDPRPRKEWADDQLAAGMDGNEACLGCHSELRDALEEHTHHPAESSGSHCYDCHMPHTSWGLLKASRSHQIDSPSVATALSTGRMNACNLCHMDQTLAWTAEKLEAWYGIPSPELSEPAQREIAEGLLHALRGDAAERAISAWNMRREVVREASGWEWMLPVLAQLLLDPYEAVRHAASGSIRALPGQSGHQFDYLADEEARRAVSQQVMAEWRKLPPMSAGHGKGRLLQDAAGVLDEARFFGLLAERDDRRVFRGE